MRFEIKSVELGTLGSPPPCHRPARSARGQSCLEPRPPRLPPRSAWPPAQGSNGLAPSLEGHPSRRQAARVSAQVRIFSSSACLGPTRQPEAHSPASTRAGCIPRFLFQQNHAFTGRLGSEDRIFMRAGVSRAWRQLNSECAAPTDRALKPSYRNGLYPRPSRSSQIPHGERAIRKPFAGYRRLPS